MRRTIPIRIVQGLLLAGVLGGLAAPGLWASRMDTKERTTRSAMNALDRALYEYAGNHQAAFPPTGDLATIVRSLGASHLQTHDGWNRPLRYASWPADPSGAPGGYALISTGADGILDANSRALLGIVEAPAPHHAVGAFLARTSGERTALAAQPWASSFDADIVSINSDPVFDHPRRSHTSKDIPPAIRLSGWGTAAVSSVLFVAVTLRHYRRSHAS